MTKDHAFKISSLAGEIPVKLPQKPDYQKINNQLELWEKLRKSFN
jgi:hypothetical protein